MGLLVMFIWLGSVFPEKYYETYAACEANPNNTCILLQQIHFEIYYKKFCHLLALDPERMPLMLPVQKADILRLTYLYQKGGIYSDFDNVIDYECLEELLEERSDFFFGEEQFSAKEAATPSNNFIYAAGPKSPQLKRLIQSVKKCQYCSVLQLASPEMLKRQKAHFESVKECVTHKYHGNWWKTQFKFQTQKQNLKKELEVRREQTKRITILVYIVVPCTLLAAFILRLIFNRLKKHSSRPQN